MASTYYGAEGLGMLAAEFESVGSLANLRSANLARQFGAEAVRLVRSHISGPPGPTPRRGEQGYLGTIQYKVGGSGGGLATLDVGSDADYAMRLEFGFVGVDSRGRHYDQPPFPHFGPAMDELEPLWEEYMASLVDFDASYGGRATVIGAGFSQAVPFE